MGVSGCGKSTIGRSVAERKGWLFLEGDDFHPETNKARMINAIPLTDVERVSWLEAITSEVNRRKEPEIVLACSALTPFVQNTLIDKTDRQVMFCWLNASYSTLTKRMNAREHFMPSSLLGSQFEALEPPADATEFSAEKPVSELVSEITDWLQSSL